MDAPTAKARKFVRSVVMAAFVAMLINAPSFHAIAEDPGYEKRMEGAVVAVAEIVQHVMPRNFSDAIVCVEIWADPGIQEGEKPKDVPPSDLEQIRRLSGLDVDFVPMSDCERDGKLVKSADRAIRIDYTDIDVMLSKLFRAAGKELDLPPRVSWNENRVFLPFGWRSLFVGLRNVSANGRYRVDGICEVSLPFQYHGQSGGFEVDLTENAGVIEVRFWRSPDAIIVN